jgi:hypothetical protein
MCRRILTVRKYSIWHEGNTDEENDGYAYAVYSRLLGDRRHERFSSISVICLMVSEPEFVNVKGAQ